MSVIASNFSYFLPFEKKIKQVRIIEMEIIRAKKINL